MEKIEDYVTSVDDNVFLLRALPEVVKGALFSRYSRSSYGLRELFSKEFMGDLGEENANNFYRKILDGYGDDSIAELGGAHIAMEGISILAAKVMEDCRIGGSPLEKSTRYVPLKRDKNGEFPFYKGKEILSIEGEEYLKICNYLFERYLSLLPKTIELFKERYPNKDLSSRAYESSIRAKALDAIRGLLPAGSLTNIGIYGNGRFFEAMIKKMHLSKLQEVRGLASKALDHLRIELGAFLRKAEASHPYMLNYKSYKEALEKALDEVVSKPLDSKSGIRDINVRLIDLPSDPYKTICEALIYDRVGSISKAREIVASMSQDQLSTLFKKITLPRKNRRDKSPRALELVNFTFEIVADYATYRDLQRHRMLTQCRAPLNPSNGYPLPEDISDSSLITPYIEAMNRSADYFISSNLGELREYMMPMGYNINWYMHISLRELQWLSELRSAPQGHPIYRRIAILMKKLVVDRFPLLKYFFGFVDSSEIFLGRSIQLSKQSFKSS